MTSLNDPDLYELVSVRCITCNRVLAHQSRLKKLKALRVGGMTLCQALDECGVKSPCCRLQYLNPDIIQNIGPDHKPEGMIGTSISGTSVNEEGKTIFVRRYGTDEKGTRLLYATPNRQEFILPSPYNLNSELTLKNARLGPHHPPPYFRPESKKVESSMKALIGDLTAVERIESDDDDEDDDANDWINMMSAPVEMDDSIEPNDNEDDDEAL